MPLLKPEEWIPEGIDELEPAAFRAVKSLQNTLVVAGPGAGKTELLAQRASFLLKTGTCPYPWRILAISFKRDAAKNLKERIQLRCGVELSRRFDSYTFDAFAKGLFDRFRNALIEGFRPSTDYELNFELERRMDQWLESIVSQNVGLSLAEAKSIPTSRFYKMVFLGRSLDISGGEPKSFEDLAAKELWRQLLLRSTPAQVDFPMIGRLAELILRTNPTLLAALRSTYAFVFLDEFQDTTNIQYDLTSTAFKGAPTVLTAVGDDKQRIMVWAGALQTIFADFERDFGAVREHLLLNHRSVTELVRIQSHLVRMVDPSAPIPTAAKTDLEGECRVMIFDDHTAEAQWLADSILEWLKTDNIEPRGICILTRNRPDQYTTYIAEALHIRGIKSRIETELQDLLAEPLAVMIVALLKIALSERAKEAWNTATEIYFEVNGIAERGGSMAKRENELATFLKSLAPDIESIGSEEDMLALLNRLMNYISEARFRNSFLQYRQGDWYEQVLRKVAHHLYDGRAKTQNWLQAVALFEGIDCVPIMTIHKSKGLEYHTVVFVGLEDSAMWSFQRAPDEEKRTFFVAFSRAIKRVVFTFCDVRERAGRGAEGQSRKSIGVFYEVLTQAGVKEERVTRESPSA